MGPHRHTSGCLWCGHAGGRPDGRVGDAPAGPATGFVCLRDNHYRSVNPAGSRVPADLPYPAPAQPSKCRAVLRYPPVRGNGLPSLHTALANTGSSAGISRSHWSSPRSNPRAGTKNQAMARPSILDSAPGPSTSNTVEVFDLKLEGTNQRVAFRRKTPSQATNRWTLGNL